MLTVAAVLVVLLTPVAMLVALALVIDGWRRAHAERVARQIMVTDAVHAELGALVSPVVEKRAFQPWRVVFAVPQERRREVARLVAITERVLGGPREDVQIVFTRPARPARPAAA